MAHMSTFLTRLKSDLQDINKQRGMRDQHSSFHDSILQNGVWTGSLASWFVSTHPMPEHFVLMNALPLTLEQRYELIKAVLEFSSESQI